MIGCTNINQYSYLFEPNPPLLRRAYRFYQLHERPFHRDLIIIIIIDIDSEE